MCGDLEAFGRTSASELLASYTIPESPSLMPLWRSSIVPKHPWSCRTKMSAMVEQGASLSLTTWRSRYESPPLTEQELKDIHIGIEEIRSGKAKHFTSLGDALEWLHRKRTK